jgi:hypothetical protein
MLPRMPHTAVIVDPAETETSRGNVKRDYTVPPATETSYNAWLQQDSTDELAADGKTPSVQTWTLIAVMNRAFTGHEHIKCLGMEFEIFGIPEPCYTLKGYHHTEMKLKRFNG